MGRGGAILDEEGGFGVDGHSSPNLVGYSDFTIFANDEPTRTIDWIDLDYPVAEVRLRVGARSESAFEIFALDEFGGEVDSAVVDLVPEMQQVTLTGPSISPSIWHIEYYTLPDTDADPALPFAIDDLELRAIPEPAGRLLQIAALATLALLARARARIPHPRAN